MTIARIALTTDFSDESRRAFAAAASLARKLDVELLLLHLAQVPPAMLAPWPEVGPYIVPEEAFDAVTKRLEDIAHEGVFVGLKVRARVVREDGVEGFAAAIAAEKVDLVVTATHGFSGVKRFLLGSFAEKLLRTAPCPVLVYRGDAGAPLEIKRIHVAHDFLPASRPALDTARYWAATFKARARLHFVIEHTASLYDYATNMQESFQVYLDRVKEQALARFRRMMDKDWQGIEAEACATVGQPLSEILREATDFGANLMVLGAHSRSGLARFFLGSVTREAASRAPCSVLAVRD